MILWKFCIFVNISNLFLDERRFPSCQYRQIDAGHATNSSDDGSNSSTFCGVCVASVTSLSGCRYEVEQMVGNIYRDDSQA